MSVQTAIRCTVFLALLLVAPSCGPEGPEEEGEFGSLQSAVLSQYFYFAGYTNSANPSDPDTYKVDLGYLSAGNTIRFSTCDAVGGATQNDTYIRLTDYNTGELLDYNDDSCGLGSTFTYTVPRYRRLKANFGCFADSICGAVVAVRIDRNANGNLNDVIASHRIGEQPPIQRGANPHA